MEDGKIVIILIFKHYCNFQVHFKESKITPWDQSSPQGVIITQKGKNCQSVVQPFTCVHMTCFKTRNVVRQSICIESSSSNTFFKLSSDKKKFALRHQIHVSCRSLGPLGIYIYIYSELSPRKNDAPYYTTKWEHLIWPWWTQRKKTLSTALT
jgi:hypothetical protein